jgi:cytidine deaminase
MAEDSESWITHRVFVRKRTVASIPKDDLSFGLTRAMRLYMEMVVSQRPDPWFHRKSDRIVLAVMAIDVDGVTQYVQGMNAEVSLPAGGSYCAERTAIVAARSRFPFVQRKNFIGIATLEVPLAFDTPLDALENPLESCGACMEWLAKLQDANPAFRIVTFTNHDLDEVVERLPNGNRWENVPFAPKARVARGTSTPSTPGSDERPETAEKGEKSLGLKKTTSPKSSTRAGLLAHSPRSSPPTTPLPSSSSQLDLTNLSNRARMHKPVRRLLELWRPPQTFHHHEVKQRIPWFPTWWLDDLVREGVVIQHADRKYSVNPAFFSTSQRNSPSLAAAPAPPLSSLEAVEQFDLAAAGTTVPGYRQAADATLGPPR